MALAGVKLCCQRLICLCFPGKSHLPVESYLGLCCLLLVCQQCVAVAWPTTPPRAVSRRLSSGAQAQQWALVRLVGLLRSPTLPHSRGLAVSTIKMRGATPRYAKLLQRVAYWRRLFAPLTSSAPVPGPVHPSTAARLAGLAAYGPAALAQRRIGRRQHH